MNWFFIHNSRQQKWIADKSRRLIQAEAQGVCSDCNAPLVRPLNPSRPDVCARCDTAYRRIGGAR